MKPLPISALLEQMAEGISAQEILAAAQKASIAEQITSWRIQHGMNQTEFAKFIGTTQPTVSKWEDGNFNFTIEKLAEIACKLNLDLTISLRGQASKSAVSANNAQISSCEHFNTIGFLIPANWYNATASMSTGLESVTYTEKG